jgi:O-succinylbenzoic acid--CoA ligase
MVLSWLPHPLAHAAAAFPDRHAVVMGHHVLTYGQLIQKVIKRSVDFYEAGLKAGDTVCLKGSPSVDWVIDFHAIGWCNACVCPLDDTLTKVERQAALQVIDPQHIFHAGKVYTGHETEVLKSNPDAPKWGLEHHRLMILTSGSTGKPKIIHLSTQQLFYSAMGSAIRLGHHLTDRWLACLPLHHIAGASILLRCIWYGTAVELVAPFDARLVAERLDSGEVTMVSMVPAMLDGTLDARTESPLPPALRLVLLGGAACPQRLLKRCTALHIPLALTWGMTETASQVTTQTPGEQQIHGDVGAPLPFCLVESDAGELKVTGPVTDMNTFSTGDLGVIVAGRIQMTGRADHMINTGGKKVAPLEVENILLTHPLVQAALVTRFPCEKWGEKVAACLVVTEQLTDTSISQISAHCRNHLSSFKIPRVWYLCDELPLNSIGKPDRKAMALRLRQLHAHGAQAVNEGVGSRDGLEIRVTNEGMLLMNNTPLNPILLAGNIAAKGDGSLRESVDKELGSQSITAAHGMAERSIGTHQGQTKVHGVEHPVEITKSSGQHLFKTGMGVLESAPIKDNTRTINLVETDRDFTLKRHEQPVSDRGTEER